MDGAPAPKAGSDWRARLDSSEAAHSSDVPKSPATADTSPRLYAALRSARAGAALGQGGEATPAGPPRGAAELAFSDGLLAEQQARAAAAAAGAAEAEEGDFRADLERLLEAAAEDAESDSSARALDSLLSILAVAQSAADDGGAAALLSHSAAVLCAMMGSWTAPLVRAADPGRAAREAQRAAAARDGGGGVDDGARRSSQARRAL